MNFLWRFIHYKHLSIFRERRWCNAVLDARQLHKRVVHLSLPVHWHAKPSRHFNLAVITKICSKVSSRATSVVTVQTTVAYCSDGSAKIVFHNKCFIFLCLSHMFKMPVIFTVRLHVMQRTVLLSQFCPSVRPSVRPSVCLSVRQMRVLWQN